MPLFWRSWPARLPCSAPSPRGQQPSLLVAIAMDGSLFPISWIGVLSLARAERSNQFRTDDPPIGSKPRSRADGRRSALLDFASQMAADGTDALTPDLQPRLPQPRTQSRGILLCFRKLAPNQPIAGSRCRGYYEWQDTPGGKQPWYSQRATVESERPCKLEAECGCFSPRR